MEKEETSLTLTKNWSGKYAKEYFLLKITSTTRNICILI